MNNSAVISTGADTGDNGKQGLGGEIIIRNDAKARQHRRFSCVGIGSVRFHPVRTLVVARNCKTLFAGPAEEGQIVTLVAIRTAMVALMVGPLLLDRIGHKASLR